MKVASAHAADPGKTGIPVQMASSCDVMMLRKAWVLLVCALCATGCYEAVPVDIVADGGSNAGYDSGADADADGDAGPDRIPVVVTVTGPGAGIDAGIDAGADAGTDAGADADTQ